MKVLELYSGIGGMHLALKASGVPSEVEAAIDINPVANSIYKHNFPDVTLLHRNIQSLTPTFINKLQVDTILMSPPCQPFTRNGLQGDLQDERTKSFVHILNILQLLNIDQILIENVKGFEISHMRNLLIDTLNKCGFNYQEFILSPTQFQVPNSRHRYYCLAKKRHKKFGFLVGPLKTEFPNATIENPFRIGEIIENNQNFSSYLLNDKILTKYLNVLDICYHNSTNSCCFTKAYTRYFEGTGSVYTPHTADYVKQQFGKMQQCDNENNKLSLAHDLNLRFFTPREVCRLMCFPESFTFPENVTDRQKYMVLGNSINVKVVSELIKLLHSVPQINT